MKWKGIIDQFKILNIKIIDGARKKIKIFAWFGIINSFIINFKPSANGCNNPNVPPSIFGPTRRCIAAIIFRSAIVKYAIEINKQIILHNIII